MVPTRTEPNGVPVLMLVSLSLTASLHVWGRSCCTAELSLFFFFFLCLWCDSPPLSGGEQSALPAPSAAVTVTPTTTQTILQGHTHTLNTHMHCKHVRLQISEHKTARFLTSQTLFYLPVRRPHCLAACRRRKTQIPPQMPPQNQTVPLTLRATWANKAALISMKEINAKWEKTGKATKLK